MLPFGHNFQDTTLLPLRGKQNYAASIGKCRVPLQAFFLRERTTRKSGLIAGVSLDTTLPQASLPLLMRKSLPACFCYG